MDSLHNLIRNRFIADVIAMIYPTNDDIYAVDFKCVPQISAEFVSKNSFNSVAHTIYYAVSIGLAF